MSKWPGFDLHAELIADVERRFWLNVMRTDECWLWTGDLDGKGYGRFTVAGKTRTSSVVSWALVNGPIPEMGLICHHCDNPPCVRPDHLFLGDHSLNRLDATSKQAVERIDAARQVDEVAASAAERVRRRLDEIRAKSEQNRLDRLDSRRARQSVTRRAREQANPTLAVPMNFTDDEVRRIRSVPPARGVDTALAIQFNVSRQAIAAIRKRETYRNVSDLPGPDDTRKEEEAS